MLLKWNERLLTLSRIQAESHCFLGQGQLSFVS